MTAPVINTPSAPPENVYERIYLLVTQVAPGQVASYGQIAKLAGRCGPRQVGYALAAHGRTPTLRERWPDLPWQRIVNAAGRLSPRRDGEPLDQAERLRAEGVSIDARGRIDLVRHRWPGPDLGWLLDHGFEPLQID